MSRRMTVLVAILLVSACAPAVPLHTIDRTGVPSGQPILCPLAQHLPFTLRGDPSNPAHVVGVTGVGEVLDITWPTGFTARYDPALEILDPTGTVVAHEGQLITDAAGEGEGHAILICGIGGKIYD